jgi:hypothetical protein
MSPLRHVAAAALTTFVLGATVSAGNWPQFRGPHGQGVSDETALPTAWGPATNVAWKTEATVKVGSTQYEIRVETPSHCRRDISHALLDGSRLDCAEGRVSVPLDGRVHTLLIGAEQALA